MSVLATILVIAAGWLLAIWGMTWLVRKAVEYAVGRGLNW